MKKIKVFTVIAATFLLAVFIFTSCGTYNYGTAANQTYYENPQWAPDYYQGTRYYYFPDIECYYDIADHDFIFLNNGQWIYVQSISPFYPSFDLYDSYIVVININVYQPWMHHQYYNSHYPKYYYRDYYDHSNIPYVRGFNENQKSAIYWTEKNYNKARNWDDQNIREKRNFSYTEADRRVQEETTRTINQQRRSTVNASTNRTNTNSCARTQNAARQTSNENINSSLPTRTNTNVRTDNNSAVETRSNTTEVQRKSDTNYYGKPIGRPVKVEPQMRNSTRTEVISPRNSSTPTRTESTPTRSNSRNTENTNNTDTNSSRSGRR